MSRGLNHLKSDPNGARKAAHQPAESRSNSCAIMTAVLSILVVDDDRLFRDEIARILKAEFEKLRVTFATNGREGVAACADALFDLIVTDLRMPILNGLEMLAELRRKKNHTPAIVASSSELPPGKSLAAGAFLFLPKHELHLLPDFARRLLGSTADA